MLQSALYPVNTIQPCIKANSPNVPTVSIGGVQGLVTYAGWVSGSVAGLYQINVQLPASGASYADASGSVTLGSTAAALPVVVTANGKTSQPSGVNLWVVKNLTVSASGLTGTHGTAWAGTTWTITGGSGTYTYATTDTMPAGLTLNSDGTITGTPSAGAVGSTTVLVTVTDTVSGLTGTASITFVIS